MKFETRYIDWGSIFGIIIVLLLIGVFGWALYMGDQKEQQKDDQRNICFAMECPYGSHPFFLERKAECICVIRDNKKEK